MVDAGDKLCRAIAVIGVLATAWLLFVWLWITFFTVLPAQSVGNPQSPRVVQNTPAASPTRTMTHLPRM